MSPCSRTEAMAQSPSPSASFSRRCPRCSCRTTGRSACSLQQGVDERDVLGRTMAAHMHPVAMAYRYVAEHTLGGDVVHLHLAVVKKKAERICRDDI